MGNPTKPTSSVAIESIGSTVRNDVSTSRAAIGETRSGEMDYGISMDLWFGSDPTAAMQTFEALRSLSIECGEPEESARGWSVRVVLSLLKDHNLSQCIETIERVADLYQGKLHTPTSQPLFPSERSEFQEATNLLKEHAHLAFRLGKFEESKDRWQQMVQEALIDEEEAWLWIGKSELGAKNFSCAIEAFQRAAGASNNAILRLDALCGQAWCLFRGAEVDRAEILFLEVLSEQPMAQAFFGMACCRATHGLGSSSLAWLKLAIGKDPHFKELAREESALHSLHQDPIFRNLTTLRWTDSARKAWKWVANTGNAQADFVDRFQKREVY